MKRRASEEAGSESPAKINKELDEASSLKRADTVVQQPDGPEPTRSRQRKAPSWLQGYVTGSSAKDLAKAVAAETTAKKSPSPSRKKGSGDESKETGGKTLKKTKEKSTSKTKTTALPDKNSNNKLLSSQSLSSTLSLSQQSSSLLSSKPVSPKPSSSLSGLINNENVLEVCEGIDIITSSSHSKSSQAAASITNRGVTSQETSHYGNHAEDKIGNGSERVGVMTALKSCTKNESLAYPKKGEVPTMLEVVICVSTSGAMGDYLAELQDKAREMVWRLQSLIPDLRIGVFAHTQGGIHDDKRAAGSSFSVANMDHNYIRTGGHSGTKWIDLGASFSQICAFVDSLEPESTVYPDYVQDNLEMALWKLQRCMSWSSCSYRTVIMLGRGRPNSSTFYLQREHWRGWIRSALEIGPKQEVPVIDWRLEARMLAQMGIHVFTLQVATEKAKSEDEEEEDEEGTVFFQETAAMTNGQHFCLRDTSLLADVIVGICCACYGPDLLQEHRDELRDENDGMVPPNLKDIFVSLGLHSNRRSLKTIPSLVGGDLQALQNKMKMADLSNGRLFSSSEDEGGFSSEGEELLSKVSGVKVKSEVSPEAKGNKKAGSGKKPKVEKPGVKKLAFGKGAAKKAPEKGVKNGRVEKKPAPKAVEKKKQAAAAKKVRAEKKESVSTKPPPEKAASKNGVVKAKSADSKSKPVAKPAPKARPSALAKAKDLAKKAAAMQAKPSVTSSKARSCKTEPKPSEKAVSENKRSSAAKSKDQPGKEDLKVKRKAGQGPLKAKEAPPPKPVAAKAGRRAPVKDNAAVKNSAPAIANRSTSRSGTLGNKVSAIKTKAAPSITKSRAAKSLVNGKQQATRGNKQVRENTPAAKAATRGARHKGSVTRGSLKGKK